MTPVQLPEVPAREVVAHHIHGTEAEVLAFRLDMRNLLPGDLIGQSVHVLTAAQLREYATEAVRLNLDAIKKWTDAKKLELMRRYDADRRIKYHHLAAEFGVSVAFIGKIINQARAMSPSETNSER